jgi:hypothetical protein
MNTLLHDKAVQLRRKGLSYNEIRKELPVSKSTLSVWLKGIRLNKKQRERLYTKQIEILSRGAPCQKERRKREVDAIIDSAASEISLPISADTYKLFGVALYWAEGDKRKNFQITNSDPHLIAFMVQWLKNIFNIDPSALRAWLNIYPQQNNADLKEFWSDVTGIPLSNFGKSFVKPAGKGFKKNILYHSTIKIYIPKGTDMRYRVYGWIKSILQGSKIDISYGKQRWMPLPQVEHPKNLPL